MKFKELEKKNTYEVESEILKKWQKDDILNLTIENRENSDNFVFMMDQHTLMGCLEFIIC